MSTLRKLPVPKQQSTLDAADYYEPLLRAKFVRGMKALKNRVSTDAIARAIAAGQKNKRVLPDGAVDDALKDTSKVVKDAFNHGGKLAAEVVNK